MTTRAERIPLLIDRLKGRWLSQLLAACWRLSWWQQAALLLMLGVLFYILSKSFTGKEEVVGFDYKVTPVLRERVVYQRGILISSDKSPAIVKNRGFIQEIIAQGTPVKKGDTLFVMEASRTEENLKDLELSLKKEELDLRSNQARLEYTEYRESRRLELLEARLKHAELKREHQLNVPDADERRLLEIEKEFAQFDLENAKSEFLRNQRLQEKGFVSESALEPFERAMKNAEVALEEVELKTALQLKGVTEEVRIELDKAVESARAEVQRHENKMNRRLADVEREIETTKLRVEKLRFEIALDQEKLSKVEVKATRDGVARVLKFWDWRSGGRLVAYKAGIERREQDVIAEVINPEEMQVKLVFNESDLGDLAVGQAVRLKIPAIGDHVFKGELTLLGSIGNDRNLSDPTGAGSGESGVVMYNAVVEFDGEGYQFKPGMSALVTVITEEKSERMLIPRSAITYESGNYYVQKEGLFSLSKEQVQGRVFDEHFFEVTSGIQEKDTVLLPTAFSALGLEASTL